MGDRPSHPHTPASMHPSNKTHHRATRAAVREKQACAEPPPPFNLHPSPRVLRHGVLDCSHEGRARRRGAVSTQVRPPRDVPSRGPIVIDQQTLPAFLQAGRPMMAARVARSLQSRAGPGPGAASLMRQ
eukprot:352281-Chlamydomonas_euryale.AAC.8